MELNFYIVEIGNASELTLGWGGGFGEYEDHVVTKSP